MQQGTTQLRTVQCALDSEAAGGFGGFGIRPQQPRKAMGAAITYVLLGASA